MNRKKYDFIQDILQGGIERKKPKKYRHYIRIPLELFDEVSEKGIIDTNELIVSESAYIEFTDKTATISFITYWHVEDTHIRILDYLVRKSLGNSPVERGGHSIV